MRPGKPELLIVHNSLSRAPLLGNRRTGAAQSTKLGQVSLNCRAMGQLRRQWGRILAGLLCIFAPYFVCCKKTWSRKVGGSALVT